MKKSLKILALTLAVIMTALTFTSCAAIEGIVDFFEDIFGSDVEIEDNAYLLYTDDDGIYRLLVNGESVEHNFRGKPWLVSAADNSFAYVFDETDEGTVMYIVKDGEIEAVNAGEAIAEIVTVSTLKPGIVYVKEYSSGDQYMLYNETSGARRITGESKNPEAFCISADGETVAFTVMNKNEECVLSLFKDGTTTTTSIENCTPELLTGKGEYVYYSAENGDGILKLGVYNISTEKAYNVESSDNFREIVAVNVGGDEIIFTADNPNYEPFESEELEGDIDIPNIFSDKSVCTYLYRYKEKKAEDRIVKLGEGRFTPMKLDSSVAVHGNFADTYFSSMYNTVHVESNYKLTTVIGNTLTYKEKISSDKKYFYYIDSEADLHKKTLGKSGDVIIASDVIDFEISEKGNLYILTAGGLDVKELVFYDNAKNRTEVTSFEVTSFSFYDYADRIYYAELDISADGITVKSAKDSATGDYANFGSFGISSLPYFSHPNQKTCYAVVYDYNAETYQIYYTSDGNKFAPVEGADNCTAVMNGTEELDLGDYIFG